MLLGRSDVRPEVKAKLTQEKEHIYDGKCEIIKRIRKNQMEAKSY